MPHPKKQPTKADASFKVRQEKERREQTIANTIGVHTLAATAASVPVRLMKRDLEFVTERLAAVLNENHLVALARQHGIKMVKDSDSLQKLFVGYPHRAEESTLGSALIELTIVLAASQGRGAQILRDTATVYKVKQEFATKEKAKYAPNPVAKAQSKRIKKVAA